MNHKDLNVYKRAYTLAVEIHKISMKMPSYLQRDLGDQIRRASRSIPSNIAEGYSRSKSEKDLVSFLRTSLGSNDEVLFNLEFMRDVNLLKINDFTYFYNEYTICGKQLYRLIESKLETSN